MNVTVLTGQLQGQPHFHWIGRKGHKQAFVAFMLRVRGPVKEGDSVARCVAYGREAERVFELLRKKNHTSVWYEVKARWRRREGDDGQHHEEFVIQPYGVHHVDVIELAEQVQNRIQTLNETGEG
jgi:single-stranded DNA-binding protein